MLVSMHSAGKSDLEVATALKQVDLTEELTRTVMNDLANYLPSGGQLSLEQIYVLEARTAVLTPPAADIPTTPAPDAATQKAILDKASDYVAKTYALLPTLDATKTTLRFQDNVEVVAPSSGMHSSAVDVSTGSAFSNPSIYIHHINSTETPIEIVNGAERSLAGKDKTPWGANGQIFIYPPGPVLSSVFQEAQAAEKIAWLRWELVNGKPAAVYSFTVDKKRSHYSVNYCCFPEGDQTGRLSYSSPTQGNLNPVAKGNLQTNTTYDRPFKATVPYHGELFVNPETGIVVRLVSQADFKSSEVVHQEDTRIDYGPVTVDGKILILPVDSFVNTEIVPNGEDSAGKFLLRDRKSVV